MDSISKASDYLYVGDMTSKSMHKYRTWELTNLLCAVLALTCSSVLQGRRERSMLWKINSDFLHGLQRVVRGRKERDVCTADSFQNSISYHRCSSAKLRVFQISEVPRLKITHLNRLRMSFSLCSRNVGTE
ncbi:uncharacterized protein LOC112342342 [Selaginella moellendorffii]|uniref:uncharacterized protein LOC112342342 n=1 Tax=Selaginella moellendorffii TaxID=88036 RepID=UPI000D1C5147|nr:uncharacterized protein LOC112342342 [Selaginella moellendorffii]|eukprot:XP_024519788.1 uncharacterized protein LOC112342342 [Selaginella moellendorffii]